MITGGRPNDLALGGHHLGLHEVVNGEPVLAHQPANAAAQADAGDAGVADDAASRGKTVGLCLVVDVPPQGTALDDSLALDGINRDGAHRRQVDHDSVVAHRCSGHVVTTPSNGDLEVAVAGEADCRGDVGSATAAGDQSWSSVYGAVPQGACAVVVMVLRGDHGAPEAGNVDRGWCCHRSSSVDWLIAPAGGTNEKAAIWTSK